eukprot:7653128-Pyramimonas_sp.AAC.1
MGMRADEDAFLNLPTTSAAHPCTCDECPLAWISGRNPTTKTRLVDIWTSLHLHHGTTGCWSRGAAKACTARRCLKRQDCLVNATN